jgi:hypothetical protein
MSISTGFTLYTSLADLNERFALVIGNYIKVASLTL